jgi:hypothetical protein
MTDLPLVWNDVPLPEHFSGHKLQELHVTERDTARRGSGRKGNGRCGSLSRSDREDPAPGRDRRELSTVALTLRPLKIGPPAYADLADYEVMDEGRSVGRRRGACGRRRRLVSAVA